MPLKSSSPEGPLKAVLNNVIRISFSVLVGRLFGGDALKAVETKAGFYTFLLIAIPLVMLAAVHRPSRSSGATGTLLLHRYRMLAR